jgi:hypothetical protein
MRSASVLPAMIAALTAPMEMPGDPVRHVPCLGQGLVSARLVSAERAAALQHQHDALAFAL